MSSRVRKAGQSRPSGRGRGNRQSSSQNFGRLQRDANQTFATRTHESPVTEHGNPNITSSILQLVGCHVLVHTVSNKIYDGVLDTISPSYVICLTNAHLHSDGNHKAQEQFNAPNKEELISRISFDIKEIICIKCKNVDLDYARKDLLQTDSMISGCNGPTNTERQLEPWQPDDDSHAVGTLDEMVEFTNGDAYDELRKTNEEKFEYKTTFGSGTMSKYQDDIETNNKELFNQREKKAERVVAELTMDAAHRSHEQLDSGQSEEEKFSSVKRAGFNPNSNRYPNTMLRGRGRSRGSGPPVNYRDPPTEHATNSDGKYNRNTSVNTNKKASGPDVPAGPKPLFSDLFNRSGMQPEMLNQHGQMSNFVGQPNRVGFQLTAQQHQRQRPHNDAPQTGYTQQQKMSQHSNVTNYHHPNLPPRMQHQKMVAAAAAAASPPLDANQTQHGVARGQNETGAASGATSPTRTDKQNSSFDNEKDKQNRGMPTNSAQRNSVEKQDAEPPFEVKSSIDNVKSAVDVTRHKEDLFKDTKGVPKQKFGKVQHHLEEKEPDIVELRNFGAKFKLEQKTPRRVKDSTDPNKLQQNETEKQDQESLIIRVSPDKAVSSPVTSDHVETAKGADTESIDKHDDVTNKERKEEASPINDDAAEQDEKATDMSSDKRPENDVTPINTPLPSVGTSIKKGLNPDAKEFKLNPNAKEYVPMSPPTATSVLPHRAPSPSAAQLYHTTRLVAASSPPLVQGNMAAAAVAQGQRFSVYPYEQLVESPSVSTATLYAANIVPHQHQGQPPQQHMQPQQPGSVVLFVNRNVVSPFQQPNVMGYALQTQQPRLGHPGQVLSPYHDSSQHVYIANQTGNAIMTHHQQQQQQQIHGPQISYSHPSTPSAQQPVQHYMVHNQPYTQLASTMQSTGQGNQMPHALTRPPTPQHAVQSATPPMHPGGSSFLIGNNQMAPVNMHHSSLVASPHVPVHLPTFPGVS